MSVTIDFLYKGAGVKELKLQSGKEGLNNIVFDVHMVETVEMAEFLKGGEMVFTIGIGIKNDEDLLTLIKKYIEKKSSGVVISIGMYVKKISQEILDYCNDNKLPLFTIPWKISTPHLMKNFTYKIIESERTADEISNWIKNAIKFPKKHESYVPNLDKAGLKEEWNYQVGIIKVNIEDKYSFNIDESMLGFVRHIQNIINDSRKILFTTYIGIELIILFYNDDEKEVYEVSQKIYKGLKKQFSKYAFSLGIGKVINGLERIHESYEDASNILKINKLIGKDRTNISSSEINIYKLLVTVENRHYFNEFYDDTIGDLEKYDLLNNTDYMHTLKSYFENNCNIKELAASLYVHRNTINYKISKIEQILNCDISNIHDRCQLYLGLMIKNIK